MSVIDDIKARLDIVDIVSDTVTLKKSGRSYTGFCPFHSNTKTPSFVVFPETQTWRCFGACAEGGDIFSFVMKREGHDFKAALELLAERAGVQLKEEGQAGRQDQQRQKLLALNAAAAAYFQQLLNTPAGAATRQYLLERGLTQETIAAFQLGYALDEWEALKRHLMERGYSARELLAAGLIVERDHQSSYDRFRHRLMIPIRDPRGRVIGFGARALTTDQVPKYLNSPQTMLFDKSATLYGLDLARQAIRESGQVVIVEGYMDVIQAYQQGARNVVAQMGTALTEAQVKRLTALSHKIVLALDADAAGNAATLRSLSLMRQKLPRQQRPTSTSRGIELEAHLGQEIHIAALPAGQDPDDILREGLEVWHRLIDQAMPALDFYESLILRQVEVETPQGKAAVVRELLPIYGEIEDNVEKTARVQRLARILGINERLLLTELKGGASPAQAERRPRPAAQPSAPPEATEAPPGELNQRQGMGLEEYCLALIVANPAALAQANDILAGQGLAGLTNDDFKRGDHQELFRCLQLWTAAEQPQIELLAQMVGASLEGRLATLAAQWHRRPPPPLEDVEQDLSKAILRLRLQRVSEQIEALTGLQQAASEAAEARHYTELVHAYRQERLKLEQSQDALSLMGRRRAEASQFGRAI